MNTAMKYAARTIVIVCVLSFATVIVVPAAQAEMEIPSKKQKNPG